METLPTVKIKTADGPLIINESDFDPDMHEIWTEPEASSGDGTPTTVPGSSDPTAEAKAAADTKAAEEKPAAEKAGADKKAAEAKAAADKKAAAEKKPGAKQ